MFGQFAYLAAALPDAAALIDGPSGHVTSRSMLLGRAREIAAQLTAAGLKRRDALALQIPNSVDFVAAWLAALQLDLVVIPIDRDATENEVAVILGHFGVRGLLNRISGHPLVSVRNVAVSPAFPAGTRLIKLTSGSTGRPKGIVTSEANLAADCAHIVSSMGITAGDRNLGAIPFSHSYGFSNLVMPLVTQGTAVVISNDYLPQSILELCNRHGCTVAPLIPMVFDHLSGIGRGDGEFVSIRTFISAGAPLPALTSRCFHERFGIAIHSFWGCSECGGITYDRHGSAVERATVGEPMDGVQLELDGTRAIVRSDSVALGYMHDAATFEPFENGRFVSDDLAAVQPDGEIALIGRTSELINTAGKKVNPREVEQVILQIEGVREVKVYGEPAGARGDVVAAAVVASPDVTREQIRTFCRAHLSAHKVPRIVKLIDSLPVDERGKVKRAALADL